METSQTIGKISEALAKAQSMMKPAAFDATNPYFKSKYATLASIMETSRFALTTNSIAVIQGTSVDEDRVVVSTMLVHSSGEWIKDSLAIKPTKDDPQGIGSAITYARRYSLSALVGIVSDEDDDGNAAVGKPNEKPAIPVNRKPVETSQTPVDTQSPPQTPKAPNVIPIAKKNDRIAKIREIFELSAKAGQSPDQMKSEIGNIIGLNRPIKESAEIKDPQLDLVLNSFRKNHEPQQQQKEAA